jgi:hypothetical protein
MLLRIASNLKLKNCISGVFSFNTFKLWWTVGNYSCVDKKTTVSHAVKYDFLGCIKTQEGSKGPGIKGDFAWRLRTLTCFRPLSSHTT